MKKTCMFMLCTIFMSNSFAIGPGSIDFNGVKFLKDSEKKQNNTISASYTPVDKDSSASIVIMHLLDKNDPGQIATGLKKRKSIEVVEVQNLKPDSSDMLVSFVKFDASHSKVENNLCRIARTNNKGSVVFQYIDTKNVKSQSEGVEAYDFTKLSDGMKKLSLDRYVASYSQKVRPYHYQPSYGRYQSSYGRYQSSYGRRISRRGYMPWYNRRPNSWAGRPPYYQSY